MTIRRFTAALLLSGLSACVDFDSKVAEGSIKGADPSYARELVEGRGNAPWVIRGNLDGQPRMISFALAPDLWASYHTESAELQQVWRGGIDFVGAVYDYRHGPQPLSHGSYYWRTSAEPGGWALAGNDNGMANEVHFLGHRYLDAGKKAEIRFELRSGEQVVRVSERPEISADGLYLERHISIDGALPVSLDNGAPLSAGQHVLRIPLADGKPIAPATPKQATPSSGSLAYGKQVIDNSDCLSCHNEVHQVVGPAFARVARKFRGKFQDEPIAALSHSIIHGSVGIWGEVPMPPHPEIPEEDARAAAVYILSLADLKADEDIPLDGEGNPYAASRDYDIGPRLKGVHPSFALENLLPEGFEPKVGGMDFTADGKLLLASWDHDGAVFLVDVENKSARRVAEGLHEPLGLAVVDERVFVLQKQELTELVDLDGDGVFDDYRNFSNDWPTTDNFHSFAFGLVHRDGALYAALSICVLPGGASCPEQQPSQGKLIRIDLEDGSVEYFASGFRTPNGIGLGPDDGLFVTDNQGDWLPASKLAHVQAGHFYGSRAVPDAGVMSAVESAPVAWLPQDEIGNSPTQPAMLREGPYAGQMVHGDVYHGGIKRVFMEKVGGQWQGAVLRFTGGTRGGVNRIGYGPDGDLYLGQIGNPGNWGGLSRDWYGLERMRYLGRPTFEILEVRASPDGFDIVLTTALPEGATISREALSARQWFYYPTEQYGGPKYDAQDLRVSDLALSADGKTLSATIPGLKPGYVVYLALDQGIRDANGDTLWAREAWYTLNAIPAKPGL